MSRTIRKKLLALWREGCRATDPGRAVTTILHDHGGHLWPRGPRALPSNILVVAIGKSAVSMARALGARALDGGEWAVGFGDRLEDADWEALRGELFPTEDAPIAAD